MFGIFAFLLTAFVSGMLCGIATIPFGVVEVSRVNHVSPVFSLRNVSSIEGNFYLGSGYIRGTENYYMFTKDERGGFVRTQIPSYNCIIFQDNDTNPHLSWQTVTYRVPKYCFVWPEFRESKDTKYDIHVPKNTIIQEFKVD